ncbi:hypothetical protein QEN19_000552 [Hanseniaspora menglaensis]
MAEITNSSDFFSQTIFNEVVEEYEKNENECPLFVIIGGVPGSGKTTITKKLEKLLLNYFDKQSVTKNEEIKWYQSPMNDIKKLDLLNTITDPVTKNIDAPDTVNLQTISYKKNIKNFNSYKELKYDENKLPFYSIKSIGGEKTSIEVHLPTSDIKQGRVATVSMDGFHVPRERLLEYEDPEQAFIKRGHFETFDSKNYLNFLKLLFSGKDILLKYPGFNHEDKDPVSNAHQMKITSEKELKICIVEGLYNLFNEENFGKSLLDELKLNKKRYLLYFFDCDDKILEERVSKRHLASGIVDNLEDGIIRFRNNDIKNGILIRENMVDDNSVKVISIQQY